MNEDEAPLSDIEAPRPVVALVGRPNVGKSALFNRMTGARKAIVEDIAGTTRDRLVGAVEWRGRGFDLVDTGGLAEPTSVEGSGHYMSAIRDQVESAIAAAQLLLFVVDAKSGTTSADHEVADLLRRSGKPALLVANKADNQRRSDEAIEFYSFGLGEPWPVSAINGDGVGELLDQVSDLLPYLPEAPREAGATDRLRVAIIGRPNVGKSALVNALLGQDRVIVSDIAGTTRDAIDTPLDYNGVPLTLVDTAGIRRPGRVEGSIERYSVMRSKDAVERADVAVVVFDAPQRLRAQDLHIVGLALDEATGLVVAGNKWDLVAEMWDKPAFMISVRRRMKFANWVPIVTVSALAAMGLDELLTEVIAAGEARQKRIQTSELNAVMQRAVAKRPPPVLGTRRLKLFYVTQPRVAPPTFIFFINDTDLITPAYRRYLENTLRGAFGYRGAGLRLFFRNRSVSATEE